MQKHHAAMAMFFVLLVSYVLNSIDRQLFAVLVIEVREAMSLSLPQVGLASTVFTLGMGLAGIPTGYLLSFMSRKAVVLLGLFIFSVATLLTAYAKGLPDLLAYRFVSGLGEAMQVTAIIAIGASYFHERRALMTGAVSFAYGVGAFVGPGMTAALLKAFDWKMPFIVFGLVGFVLMAVVAICVKSWFSESRANEQQASNDRGNLAGSDANETIWNATTIALGLASVCSGLAVFGFGGLYPTYLRSALGFTPQQAALVMGAMGAGGFLAPLGGWLGDRIGYHKILMVALPLTALSGGLAFTELERSLILHAMVAGTFGIAVLSLLYSNLSAIIISSMGPAKTAQTSGLFIASYYIPAAFAGFLLAQLKEALNWTTAGILQTSGFALIAMILIAVAGATRRSAMTPVRT
ncbi:MFS transporter [Bradyrhizobium lablabi]|uniref:MFS transporter n=1 Tax=Bradyrhizobium lablabi TaxID=722472 RepID=UPI001BA5A332|nr:MFS transporter [Bradyrhizobium lablabi]MBR1123238.1 MFS transporter [Bradyrhizobium lablabi]